MARSDAQPGLTPSLLDRFIDPAYQHEAGPRPFTVAETIDAVRRDLEDLLNTRQSSHRVPPTFEDVLRLHRGVRDARPELAQRRHAAGAATALAGCWRRSSKPSSRGCAT